MPPLIADVFRHNLWANLRLLDACAALGPDKLAASAPGTYGAVSDTLVHMLASEGRYLREFTRRDPEQPLVEGMGFPGCASLQEHARASGGALIGLAERTRSSRLLRGTYRGQPYVMRAGILLVQAVNHATEHRSHVVSILNQRGVETPRLDAIAYFQDGAP